MCVEHNGDDARYMLWRIYATLLCYMRRTICPSMLSRRNRGICARAKKKSWLIALMAFRYARARAHIRTHIVEKYIMSLYIYICICSRRQITVDGERESGVRMMGGDCVPRNAAPKVKV